MGTTTSTETKPNRWLLLAAGATTHALSDAELLDCANRARHDGNHAAADLFLAVLAARVS